MGKRLKKEGEGEGTEAVIVGLTVEFLGAEHLGPGQLELFEVEGRPACQIGDKWLLTDAVAVGKGIAIQKDVLKHSTAVHRDKEVAALLLPYGKTGVACRPDQTYAEVVGQVPAQAGFKAAVGIGGDIAQRAAQMGNGIACEGATAIKGSEMPLTLINRGQARLVFQLMLPAVCPVQVAEIMHHILRLLGKGARSDHAQLQLDGVHPLVASGMKCCGKVGPAGIGAVVADQIAAGDVGRGVHILAEREFDLALQGRVRIVDKGQLVKVFKAPLRQFAALDKADQVRRDEGNLDAVGVVAIRTGKEIVFKIDIHAPRQFRFFRSQGWSGRGETAQAKERQEKERLGTGTKKMGIIYLTPFRCLSAPIA